MKNLLTSVVLSLVSAATFAQAPAEKSINQINNGMPNRISMNVTVAKQTQGATFGEKVNQGLQSAGSVVASGSAVAGIAVAPGVAAKTDEHRTYTGGRRNEANMLEKDASIVRSEKGISEKGIKRTADAAAVSPGQPIGGIVVKGGITQ